MAQFEPADEHHPDHTGTLSCFECITLSPLGTRETIDPRFTLYRIAFIHQRETWKVCHRFTDLQLIAQLRS